MSSAAAWGRKDWNWMKQAVTLLPRDSQDGAFYRAVLNIHHGEYEVAQQLIEQTRDMLDTELTALAAESYQRAYPIMIQVGIFFLKNFNRYLKIVIFKLIRKIIIVASELN